MKKKCRLIYLFKLKPRSHDRYLCCFGFQLCAILLFPLATKKIIYICFQTHHIIVLFLCVKNQDALLSLFMLIKCSFWRLGCTGKASRRSILITAMEFDL